MMKQPQRCGFIVMALGGNVKTGSSAGRKNNLKSEHKSKYGEAKAAADFGNLVDVN